MTPDRVVVRAPGKLFLTGEYAVLYGAPALVAAVNRYAVADSARRVAPTGLPAFAAQAAERALTGADASPGPVPEVNTSAFRDGERKLGFGSSAAATVCIVAERFVRAGLDLAVLETKRRITAAAIAAHDAFQGTPGSGADVAAAVYGGVLRYTRADEPVVEPHALPDVCVVAVDVGAPASTAALVSAVRAARATHPAAVAHVMGEMTATANEAAQTADPTTFLRALRRAHGLLVALGAVTGAPIVTPAIQAVVSAAEAVGGAAKGSGAGGGDIVIAAFADTVAARAFAVRAIELSFAVVPVALGAPGVHLVDPSATDTP